MKLISVIVPVYNVENYFDKCVQSILAQTYQNFELLLIDDGSTDNSGKMCDNYLKVDNRIKVFHIKNEGVSNARNFGISNASGSYIAFIDSDDYIDPSYLQKLCTSLESSDADISFCKKTTVYPSRNEVLKETALVTTANLNYNEYIKKYFLLNASYDELIMGSIWRTLFRKDIIVNNNIKFDVNLAYSEDMCFLFDYLSKIKSVAVVDEPLYYYVMRSSSSINNIKKDNLTKYEKFYDAITTRVNDKFVLKQIAYQSVYHYVNQYACASVFNKDIKKIYKSKLYKSFKLSVLLNSPNKNIWALLDFVLIKFHLSKLHWLKNKQ